VLPRRDEKIAPGRSRAGETVLVSAHGNPLRALVKTHLLRHFRRRHHQGSRIPDRPADDSVYELDDNLAEIERYYLSRALRRPVRRRDCEGMTEGAAKVAIVMGSRVGLGDRARTALPPVLEDAGRGA
jgi:hypothetical protein